MSLQRRILKILQGKFARYIALFFIAVAILSIIASSFEEMRQYHLFFFGITYFSSFVFLIEYVARIYSAPALYPKLRPMKARTRYTLSFYGFVDFVAVWPCLLTYLFWGTPSVNLVILPYIFIIFKLIRHMRSFTIIRDAVRMVKGELITAYTACLILVSFAAILMYYIEHEAQPDVFRNIFDGVWWAIVTFTTTGYGDIYPVTYMGKFLGMIISLVGIAMIALPTGIISSSFINIFQQRQTEKMQREVEERLRREQEQKSVPAKE